MSKRLTIEQIIKGFRQVHKDKYDYSLITEYKNNEQKLPIVCPQHGVFYQSQYVHSTGHGCPECAKVKSDNIKRVEICRRDFERKARAIHGDKYDYSKVKYVNNSTPVEIVCPEHGSFFQIPYSHLNKKARVGCPVCGRERNQRDNERRKRDCGENFERKARRVHGNKYDYSLVKYVNANTKIEIVCPQHGSFWQFPNYHLSGNGCPKCAHHISKWEQEIFDLVDTWFPGEVYHSQKGLIKGKRSEIDIWIPEKNIGIECDGLHWHSDKFSNTIIEKQNASVENGFRLINIFEDEWTLKRPIVESRLKALLGIPTVNKIYARQCEIRQISNQDATNFLSSNHLQGGNPYSYMALGLFYQNNLVSVMLFCKPRVGFGSGKQEPGKYELLKFASLLDTTVVGAASKLLKYFIRNSDATEIYSFADRRWSDGHLYKILGFLPTHTNPPNYFYIINDKRVNRFGFRKSELVRQGYDPTKSEAQIMQERGIEKIYDAGTIKYVLKIV